MKKRNHLYTPKSSFIHSFIYSLRMEGRQELLHERSGSTAVNAFVEVVLCRTIGHKKDEYLGEIFIRNVRKLMGL